MNEDDAHAVLATMPGFDSRAKARLKVFVSMLCQENARQNLVSEASLERVWQRHILDSAQLVAKVPRGTSLWLDLGSGGGLPGIVVASLLPHVTITLVESRRLRADWLCRICDELDLQNVEVLGSKLQQIPSAGFDVISARAFAPLDRLLALSARFSTADTVWLLPKGQSAQSEVDMLTGWRHAFRVEQSVTDTSAGIIVGTLRGQEGGIK